MLIQRAPDVYEKLRHLGGMATDDILAPAERPGGARLSDGWQGVGPRGGVTPHAGVYRAAMPNGKRISLMRVMFTDHCIMDCHYCPNSHWVPRRRYGFKVDELARLFDEMHSRHTVDGLFLSSGIFNDPNTTQERLINVVEAIRTRYKFQGYIHLKVMPGTSDHALIEASQRLGARLSINMESPSREHLESVSKMKDFDNGILAPMQRISELMQETYGGAVGQATQLVVGAANESDWDIYSRMRNLYGDLGFKRVYYSAFRPVRYTPLEEHPATPPVREHRLYQLDWLSRIYGYDSDELRPAFDTGGFLNLRVDPKLMVAANNIDHYPVDVNQAGERDLLRVPGIGPTAAARIVTQRREHSITRRQELQAMGVVLKRALPFLRFPGHRPAPGKQGELPLFEEQSTAAPATSSVRSSGGASALHAEHAATGCASCPLSPVSCGMPAP